MTVYLGELIDGGTHHFYFTTVDSTGLPTTLSGTPVLSVYKDANTTETTTGPAITADFDTRTGLNAVTLTLTDAFYVADTDYQVVITTGTVSGVSVVGYVVATFSIQNRGVDWGNIQRPASTVDLSATDIQLVDTATAVTNAVTVGTMNANVINAASIATSAMDGKGDWNVGKTGYTLTQSFPANFAAFAITAGGAITVGTNSDKTGYSISGAKTTLDALNDVAATAIVSAGAITTAAGAVANVDLVDTCSVNSDMVGTNGALLAASAPTNFGDLAITLTTGLMSVGTNNDKADYNIASIDANAINAASIAAAAMDGKGDWNIGKAGYAISGALTTLDALENISTADVNTQMVDVMTIDTQALPGQAAPPLAPTFSEAITWIYKGYRNRTTQTATQWSLFADDETTVDAKATVSDDSTTAIKQEIVSGP